MHNPGPTQIVEKFGKVMKRRKETHDDVTANDVIDSLFSLFENLGIDVARSATNSKDTSKGISAHPLFRFADGIYDLLTSWHQDTRYLDQLGQPAPIKNQGPAPSFQDLAITNVPELDQKRLLEELERVGAVEVGHNKLIYVRMRSFPSYENKQFAAQHTLKILNGFIKTLRHNLESPPANSEQLFHRIARNAQFDIRELPALKIRVKRHGQQFLESCDSWLLRKTSSRVKSVLRRTRSAEVTVGVYLSVERKC